ncbi:hypothetical protein [Pseudoalteromonas tunicata]|jgi:hypothetical protein|uniref:Orphan protein n=1 Tax=Pseudoalteromonas tunicata D2 TaxID=87626 RepID=A4CCM2_9GAMM|nr:hypothetical protein [Pseudoalteromonas tunicata]ATC93816.1 hypothetical protein PTUN_a1141 [Pseudoalteromonas tunicata]AXT29635.1 hypothetical protein D1819_01565 [Pseudoalteromonas tunicata]EAR27315.1 hypothetical protein PTD2_14787 [Pseudoalteromonas tunicata D2]
MNKQLLLITSLLLTSTTTQAHNEHQGHILAEKSAQVPAAFDIVHTKVTTQNGMLIFQQEVAGVAGSNKPKATGNLAGANVYSYVWPTNLNSAQVGFEKDQGILALALTIHPDFDDTPLYDEDNDGIKTNDGDNWHSHWVVLVNDEACGPGALKVKDIPKGSQPKLPATWPNLPLFIDSPGYDFKIDQSEVLVQVPLNKVNIAASFAFDGVTSALRINQQVHDPLLCVSQVFDIASGDLNLPGQSQ